METQQSVDKEAILHAAEERIKELRKKTPSQILYRPHDEEHDKRQAFRRRVDYIIGANKPAQAIQSLKTILKLAHNVLQNPEEDKYRRFKITNDRVQKTIMVPEGVCDLLVDLGFREKGCSILVARSFRRAPQGLRTKRLNIARRTNTTKACQ